MTSIDFAIRFSPNGYYTFFNAIFVCFPVPYQMLNAMALSESLPSHSKIPLWLILLRAQICVLGSTRHWSSSCAAWQIAPAAWSVGLPLPCSGKWCPWSVLVWLIYRWYSQLGCLHDFDGRPREVISRLSVNSGLQFLIFRWCVSSLREIHNWIPSTAFIINSITAAASTFFVSSVTIVITLQHVTNASIVVSVSFACSLYPSIFSHLSLVTVCCRRSLQSTRL